MRLRDEAKLEAIYLRPTNGRADDQLRRNHAVQYISHPEHLWERLRAEPKASTAIRALKGCGVGVAVLVFRFSARYPLGGR